MEIRKSSETYFGLSFIATGRDTNGKYFLSQAVIPAGDSGPPLHTHTNEDEGFYLKKGKLTFLVNGRKIVLKAGEYLNIESGEEHTWRNDSQSEAELFIIFTPAGIEHMFKELDQNLGDIKVIGERFGTQFMMD